MGMQTMSVQPSTQPSGKGSGFSSPQPQNADITTAVPSAFSGQPRFGQPNQYAQTMGWDKAQFGGASAGNAFFRKEKASHPAKVRLINRLLPQPNFRWQTNLILSLPLFRKSKSLKLPHMAAVKATTLAARTKGEHHGIRQI